MRIRNWRTSVFRKILLPLSRPMRRKLRPSLLANGCLIGSVAGGTILACPVFADDQTYVARGYFETSNAITSGIASADFNGDGIQDLALTGTEGLQLSIMLGESDGSFMPPAIYSTNLNPFGFGPSIAADDFNGDGFVDVIVAGSPQSNFSSNVAILFGNADGSLQSPSPISVPSNLAYYIFSSDFDGDGNLDIIANNNNSVSVIIGHGDGTFEEPNILVEARGSIRGVTTDDFNGDGLTDLAITTSFGGQRKLEIFLGQGNFQFSTSQNFCFDGNVRDVVAADFDGDGLVDLATTEETVNIYYEYTLSVVVFLGQGDGTFADGMSTTVDESDVIRDLHVVDFNGDGLQDLATGSTNGSTNFYNVTIWENQGNGDFGFEDSIELNADVLGIVSGDFNGDGAEDLAVALQDGGFGLSAAVLINQSSVPTLFGDLNLDCVVDLLDVSPFIDLLVSGKFLPAADINVDGSVDLLDVQPFVELLSNQ